MVSLKDVLFAKHMISDVISRTALIHDEVILNNVNGNEVFLKMENLQRTGSFKLRGAYNKISGLSEEEKMCGVIASSAGNHAQGVAFAAQTYGIAATIVMPRHAPLSKVKSTQAMGAKVVLHGDVYDDAYAEAMRLQQETGATFIHPFNDPLVIAGQGTIGMEIMEDLPDVNAVMVPIGGGGLIAGVAATIKQINRGVRVIGVQAKNMPAMEMSFKSGALVSYSGETTLADGIAVKNPGDLTFELIKKYVDDIVTVDEDEIAQAILFLLEKAKTVAEGAGAVSVAAALRDNPDYKNKKIACVVSGGNIDVNILARIIDRGLMKSGRKIFCDTMMIDRPGTLSKLLLLIAEIGANIIQITHSRNKQDIKMGYANAVLEMETTDEQQVEKIKKVLAENGYLAKIY